MLVNWKLNDVELSNGLRAQFDRRIEKLGKRLAAWSEDAVQMTVSMEKVGSKDQYKCTLNLHLPQKTLHAEEVREEKKTAFKSAFDDLLRQEKRMMARFRRQDRYEDVAEAKRSIPVPPPAEEAEAE
jgi:ribosomal subunit interface protein